MKYVVWGSGYRGKVLMETIGADNIIAFIDSDKEKLGKTYCGKPIISYEKYKESYSEYVILISIVYNERVSERLEKQHMFHFNIEDCPPEFAGYGWRRAQKSMKDLRLELPDRPAVYGSTLYSVMVYEKLKERGYSDVTLIPHKSMTQERIEQFAEYFPHISLDTLENTSADGLLITVYDSTISKERQEIPHIDVYDWTLYADAYKNDRIAAMKDKYKGQRCFIVATGPSLTMDDLETLHNHQEFCISMNSIFKCFADTKWRPNQYMIVDTDAISLWENEMKELDVEQKFVADSQMYFDYETLSKDWYVYHSVFGRESLGGDAFSDDFSVKAYHSGTITNICIQLAVYLGFSEIYLLGVDFTREKGKVKHFHADINEDDVIYESEAWLEILYKYSLKEYQASRKYADSHGIKIYNATRGGALEVFERVDFDSLFI